MCQDPISKQGHILRFLVDIVLGERHCSAHCSQFRSPVIFRWSRYHLPETHLLGCKDHFSSSSVFYKGNILKLMGPIEICHFNLKTQTCTSINGFFYFLMCDFSFLPWAPVKSSWEDQARHVVFSSVISDGNRLSSDSHPPPSLSSVLAFSAWGALWAELWSLSAPLGQPSGPSTQTSRPPGHLSRHNTTIWARTTHHCLMSSCWLELCCPLILPSL